MIKAKHIVTGVISLVLFLSAVFVGIETVIFHHEGYNTSAEAYSNANRDYVVSLYKEKPSSFVLYQNGMETGNDDGTLISLMETLQLKEAKKQNKHDLDVIFRYGKEFALSSDLKEVEIYYHIAPSQPVGYHYYSITEDISGVLLERAAGLLK